MQIKVSRIEDGPAHIEVIDSTDGAIAHSIDLNVGEEVVINAPTAASPADIEVGEVTPISASDPAEGVPDPGESPADAGASGGEGVSTPAEPDPAAGGAPSDQAGAAGGAEPPAVGGEEPTTSAASDKPLYRVLASEVPEGFADSGLATPDGFTLYSYEGDTAGQPHTFDVGDASDIGLYAEADDIEQPVVSADAHA